MSKACWYNANDRKWAFLKMTKVVDHVTYQCTKHQDDNTSTGVKKKDDSVMLWVTTDQVHGEVLDTV